MTYEQQLVFNAVREAFDISHLKHHALDWIGIVAAEMTRPSVLYRPSLGRDGNMWCALYGSNIQEGFAAFGETPEAAMAAFDEAWKKERANP